MRLINYVLIAFASWFLGAFMMVWYNLDNPVKEVVEKVPLHIENNYYLKYDASYILMPQPPTTQIFHIPKPIKARINPQCKLETRYR